jgi:hypothetical protein
MRIEKAIFTNEPEKFDLSSYDRLYFGNEFCENNILDVDRVKEIMNRVEMDLTFVTPYLTDFGIEKVRDTIKALPKGIEVVFNDYGLMHFLDGFTPVFGRLLNKQRRGPRIVDMKKKISKDAVKYFQSCNIKAMEMFLKKFGVNRAEVDNVIQGFSIKSKISLSLYYPYIYVSTTRLCLLNDIENVARKKIRIKKCKKECEKYVLENSKFPLKMILKGNTQFYFNDSIPKKGYNRLVYMPEIII